MHEQSFIFSAPVILLVSEPFPDPNSRRPISITGCKAGEPFNMAPIANVDDPNTQRNENKKTPTANINK